MATNKQFTLQQYLNMAGLNSRDKFVANKMLAQEESKTIFQWTKLMIDKKVIDQPTSSVIGLLSKEEISSLKR